jgi:hypothetical protein
MLNLPIIQYNSLKVKKMSKIQELKIELKEARIKYRALKTKATKEKQQKIINEIYGRLKEALLAGLEPYLNTRHKGKIVSGGHDALAQTEFGLVPIYACNDKLSKSWYSSTCCVSYKTGDDIIFEIKHLSVVDGRLHWFAGEVEGGTFDEAKYKELCKQDTLAFFRKSDGIMTGLFK